MRASLASLLIVCFLTVSAWAGAAEDDTIGLFESFCLEQASPQDDIPHMAATIGMQELQGPEFDRLLLPAKGRLWGGVLPSGKFILMLTDRDICSVQSIDGVPSEVQVLLEKSPGIKMVRADLNGSQSEKHFVLKHLVNGDGQPSRFVVSLITSTLQTVSGAKLVAISERAFKKIGATFPE